MGMMDPHLSRIFFLTGLVVMAVGIEAGVASEQRQVNTRDPTPGKIWIERLERPNRIPGKGDVPRETGMPERRFVVYGR